VLPNLLVCCKNFKHLAWPLPCIAASVLSSQSLKSTLEIRHILSNLIFFLPVSRDYRVQAVFNLMCIIEELQVLF